MSKTKLVPLSAIEPAQYNPREASAQRLEFLKLSLRKLGFLLPLYALPNGHLLSGHQRSLVMSMIGGKDLPVSYIDVSKDRVRNINLVFNRATNDMTQTETSNDVWGKMSLETITRLSEELPDRDPESPEFFRCLTPVDVPLKDIVKHLTVPYDSAAMEMCVKLFRYGIIMPIVMTRSGRVLNGQYRIMAARDRALNWYKAETYPVVYVEEAEADLSEALLNFISMNFTVENQYADQLRYGAFRREMNVVDGLVPSYRFLCDNYALKAAHQTFKDTDRFWNKFRQKYGESICDLGAGQRRTRLMMEPKGIHVSDWEPYPLNWRGEVEEDVSRNKPSLALSRQVSDRFLADVASGIKYSTVGLPAVLNSVPFRWDRMCVLALAHSLVGFSGQLVGACRNNTDTGYGSNKGPQIRVNESGKVGSTMSLFKLEYEPGIYIGDINVMPKVQKMHSKAELEADLRRFFEWVKIVERPHKLLFHAKAPKRISPRVLKAALMHEFNLPYENGESIGRADAALAAFGQRMGINFDTVEAVEPPK